VELADLVRAMRALLHWLLIGAVLFAGKRALQPPMATSLVVSVAADATATERSRAVDEALLIAVAEQVGVPLADPLVRDRLTRNMRFAGESGSDAALLQRAVDMGMHRRDAVARRRLIETGRRLLAPNPVSASDEQLRRFVAEHPSRFRTTPSLRFEQLFLSAERRGETLEGDAARLKGRLDSAESDPSLLPATMSGKAARIDATFGPGFTAQLEGAAVGRWHGPVRSSFGLHYVRLLSRRDDLRFTEVRAEAALALSRERSQRDVRRALDALRGNVDIREVRQ
jgi:hypothetical protein